jgi:iron transport multicopper oxidase
MVVDISRTQDFTKFLINNSTFTSPAVPVLLQILSGATQASDLLPKGNVYGLGGNKSVEISIPAGALGGPVS